MTVLTYRGPPCR